MPVALLAEADIAGIDAVFVERGGAVRMLGQQDMAVIVEVADDRDIEPHLQQLLLDMRDCRGRFGAVDRDAHQFRTGAGERRGLAHRALDIGGVGIGHGLHHDRGAAADRDVADHHRHGPAPVRRSGGFKLGGDDNVHAGISQ